MFERLTGTSVGTLPNPPTWEGLAAREPRLSALLAEARRRRQRQPDFDPLAAFFGYAGAGEGFKARLVRLVGWGRPGNDAFLGSSAAYEVAYERILAALEGDDGDEPQ